MLGCGTAMTEGCVAVSRCTQEKSRREPGVVILKSSDRSNVMYESNREEQEAEGIGSALGSRDRHFPFQGGQMSHESHMRVPN
jgi:hypothetical protein